MAVPYVSAVPTPTPTRADAGNFDARAEATLGAFPGFVDEVNVLGEFVNACASAAAASAASAANSPGTNATSTTPQAIQLGPDGPFYIQTGKNFVVGQWVNIARTSEPLKYMIGPILSYDGVTGAMIVDVQRINGSGSYNDWTISLSAPVLADGTPRNLAAGSTVKDKTGGTDRLLGFRGMPTKLIQTAYTVTVDDVGFCLELGAGASLIMPRNSTLAAGSQFGGGDVIVFQEIAGSTKTLSPAASTTLRQKGTTNTGMRTIKANGGGSVQLAGNLVDTWFTGGDLT